MTSSVYIRPLLALLVMAAIIGIVSVVLRDDFQRPEPVRPSGQQLPGNIDVALRKARFSEIQNGVVVWELVAERVDYDKSGDTAYLVNIRMEFPQRRSQGGVVVTSDSGEYVTASKNIRLRGHVHVVTEDGGSFDTASVDYSGAKALFSTRDPIVFRQQRLQLNAVGMDLGVNSQRARFYSAVDAAINMN